MDSPSKERTHIAQVSVIVRGCHDGFGLSATRASRLVVEPGDRCRESEGPGANPANSAFISVSDRAAIFCDQKALLRERQHRTTSGSAPVCLSDAGWSGALSRLRGAILTLI